MQNEKKRLKLRSQRWFSTKTLRGSGHKSRIFQLGLTSEDIDNKPIIGIINTWSEINHCHSHLKDRAANVKTGISQSGGVPIEMPAISLAEVFQKPSTMMYRNLLAMETEELLRSYPIDGCVLMGGCDKTTPALLMGAISMDIPTIFVPAGAMLRGHWRGQTLGSGSDIWKYWDELRAGTISENDWQEMLEGIARSPGTCMTMGTASTMTSIAEVMGFTLPNASSIPAPDSGHSRMATYSGRRIVEMVKENLKPSDIITKNTINNAIRILMALGGSTNGLIHVIALARRAGINLELDHFETIGQKTPFLVNLRPAGKYLMEDFYYAGGLNALMEGMRDLLDTDEKTCTGRSLGENIQGQKIHNSEVIKTPKKPINATGGLLVLRGNLAPDGAIIKANAADPKFHEHTGPAIVFDSYAQMSKIIDDPKLKITKESVLVLRNSGPIGGPGMPEWGMLPIPKKLLKQGVRDMVRISDARMSGTSYGTCILHVAPESWVGGPLGLVKTGDLIKLSVRERTLNLMVSKTELESRKKHLTKKPARFSRGYGKMFSTHVLQANEGCDFDFLQTNQEITPEPYID